MNTPEAGVLGGREKEMGFKRFQGRQLAWRLQEPMLSKEISFPKTKGMLHVCTGATEEHVFPCFLNDLAHLLRSLVALLSGIS